MQEEDCVPPQGSAGRIRATDKYFWCGHSRLGFLVNEYQSPFEIDGMKFMTVSWYMWYMRAKAWAPDTSLAVLIKEADGEEKAKQLSRRCIKGSPSAGAHWMSVRIKTMAKAVKRKFECSEELARSLVETGEDRLVYASRFDAFYGIGFTMLEGCERQDEWGRNLLGQMLMLVRTRLNERGMRSVNCMVKFKGTG